MAAAELRESIFGSAAMLGVRLTIGFIFMAHGITKFAPEFAGQLQHFSMSVDLHYPIAAGEFVPGILLVVGVLGRISAAILAIIMLGAIFVIHGVTSLAGDDGIEFPLMLLAACLLVMVMGPGRISLAAAIQRLPRWLH